MILLPAIDILGGQAVRLAQGEFDAQTIYDADPLDAARRWVADGARALHVVDLDGARAGAPVNVEHVERIAASVPVPVQVGGGLRNIEAVAGVLGRGAARAILGTAALSDGDLVEEAVARFGERVVVSVDVRGGQVASWGWREQSQVPAETVIERLGNRGVRRFVYSSIERDGMLSGPDLEGTGRVAGVIQGSFIYSGGISSLADLASLAALEEPKLDGVIAGKALYEGRFSVAEGQRALEPA